MSSAFLDLYDPLDIIGNGSFGVIRKVRRKADGLIFARKELNFERMSERDRKQIVAEVNILKDLHHDHIVRYHDRHVDRDAGVLYILMEYCGGGDLSAVIKQAAKHGRPIPEETVWHYFMQILLALHHCHHPHTHGHGRTGSGSGGALDVEGGERRAQILHRDLKPDNVFLDEANIVKLGDFGLSKVLGPASFANTYVGTPYYMSPELMQEKAYDSKSDIWSLGCLIYELCALKPPFHEAKTHSELSICIRNGRIPPLPRGYSQALWGVIKAMLNLNPAMRPSAAQLLQHERLELVFKVAETEKMLSTVKAHKATVATKEREVLARESAVLEREQELVAIILVKDREIAALQHMVGQLQQHRPFSQGDLDVAVKEAVAKREEELRVLVTKREKVVAEAMAVREEEIMEAVRRREAEVFEAWGARETEIRREMEEKIRGAEERVQWVQAKEDELRMEDSRLEAVRADLEEEIARWEESAAKGRKEKTPLEEVKNLLVPLARLAHDTPAQRRKPEPLPASPSVPNSRLFPPLATPVTRPSADGGFMPSAMKGVILTATGEALATPTPAELAHLFNRSPKVGLNFTKIFDFGDGDGDGDDGGGNGARMGEGDEEHSPPPSPSSRKEREREKARERDRDREAEGSPPSESGSSSSAPATAPAAVQAHPTRLRRPSIRTAGRAPSLHRAATLPASTAGPSQSASSGPTMSTSASQMQPKPLPLPHPHLHATTQAAPLLPHSVPSPEYDFADEENLPSPFIKRTVGRGGGGGKRRPSGGASSGALLRAVVAANAAKRRGGVNASGSSGSLSSPSLLPSRSAGEGGPRPSVASARKAGDEARKALLKT